MCLESWRHLLELFPDGGFLYCYLGSGRVWNPGWLPINSCGLEVVSTPAGGVEEVLPASILNLCTFEVDDIVQKLSDTIHKVEYKKKHNLIEKEAFKYNELVRMRYVPLVCGHWRCSYSWGRVADRVERVYDSVSDTRHSLLYHFQTYLGAGVVCCWCARLMMFRLLAPAICCYVWSPCSYCSFSVCLSLKSPSNLLWTLIWIPIFSRGISFFSLYIW